MDITKLDKGAIERYIRNFKNLLNVQIIEWKNTNEAIGLSIVKDYPKNIKVVFNQKGQRDTVALIKVFFYIDDFIQSSNGRHIKLNVRVDLASRYLFNHMFYSEEDKESPLPSEAKLNEKYKNPASLEDLTRYEYNFIGNKFYDKLLKRNVSAKTIVNTIYKIHIETPRNLKFQTLMRAQRALIKTAEWLSPVLININYLLFGMKKKDHLDFTIGIFKPYSLHDFEETDVAKLKILGTDLPLNPRGAITFIFFFGVIFFLKYYFKYDLFGLYKLFTETTSVFFLTILTTLFILLICKVIPLVMIGLINLIDKLALKLRGLKIKV